MQGASNHSVAKPGFQIMPSEMMDWKSVYEFALQGKSFNYSQVIEFVKDNIGTFMSVRILKLIKHVYNIHNLTGATYGRCWNL